VSRPDTCSRRQAAAALLALPMGILLVPGTASGQTAPSLATEALRKLALRGGGVQIDLAPLSDTGNAVPLAFTLDAPAGLRVVSFEILTPDNPETLVMRVKLGQPSARYRFATRVRLSGSQDIWVVASLSDGSRIGASAATVVTSSACFDAT
jgi:sulfur-oxidizing protein SoxY